MTREEAILLLHDMKDTYDEIHENTNGDLGYEQITALDMAIEALDTQDLYLKALERMIEFHRAFTRLLDEKTEQTEATCETCKYNCFSWDEEVCESCTMGGEDNHWERKEKEENVLSNLDTKITPTCDRHIDDRYGTLVGGITGESFCSYGERREP